MSGLLLPSGKVQLDYETPGPFIVWPHTKVGMAPGQTSFHVGPKGGLKRRFIVHFSERHLLS